MKPPVFITAALMGLLSVSAASKAQSERPEARQGKPVLGARPPANTGWQLRVGSGVLLNPTYLGADSYQLSVLPNIQISYDDLFFASVQNGVGFNLVRKNGWKVGPIVRFNFGRDETGNSPFRVVGDVGNDLVGLNEIDFTFEAGGFVAYETRSYSARLELRQGVNGHEGFVADISANKRGFGSIFGKRAIYSFGPRLQFGDANFNNSFFGVSNAESQRSGLGQYSAGGGLTSYGFGGNAIVPLNRKWSVFAFAGYDRLAGEAANSTLVQERGSANQISSGLFLTYSF